MPLSAAEKQRCYSAHHDADPERRQKYLNEGNERRRKDSEEGIKKKVQTSVKDKGAQRTKWQERKRKHRDRARSRTTGQENKNI